MKKEDMMKAATLYADDVCKGPRYRWGHEQVAMVDFIEGAKWRINSVWHNLGKEMPECNRHVVNEDWFDFIAKDEKDLARIIKKYPFKQWAYIDDLLPERKEETE